MNKPGRKKTKYGRNITIYLSNQAIAKLTKLAEGNKSQYIENQIVQDFHAQEVNWKESKEDKEIQELLGGINRT